MSKTIFITGAAGFIGSNLLEHLFDKYPDDKFIVLDLLTYAGNIRNIPERIQKSDRYEFWYGDVANPYIVNDLMKRADYVVHMAAETHVARSIYDNSRFFHTDVIGTQVMMNALLKCENVERFIYISTSEVYGTAVEERMSETHGLNPKSPYAGAKAGADRLVYSYWSTYPEVPVVILRPFNNYGGRQHLEKMTPRFITSALMNHPLTVHGDGGAMRDWVYVEDCCEAIDRALHSDNYDLIKHQIINIGTGESTSVLEMAGAVLKIIDKPVDMIKLIGDRPGQVECHRACTKKAEKLLGWKARTKLNEGLNKTIQWYAKNENWWKDMEWMKSVPIKTASGIVEMH